MKTNTNGYRPSHRNKWLLLQHKVLTKEELLLFEYYLDQMDFDIRHTQFGTFQIDFAELSKLFGYSVNKSNTSIRPKHNKLLKLGFIHSTTDKSVFSIHNPERYIAQTNKWQGKAEDFRRSEMNQSIETVVRNTASTFQLDENKFQPTKTIFQPVEKNDNIYLKNYSPRTLGSSKVKSNVSKQGEESLTEELGRHAKTADEYKKTYKEGKYSTLTPEDMDWIDDNQ